MRGGSSSLPSWHWSAPTPRSVHDLREVFDALRWVGRARGSALARKPDGSGWGGQDLEDATGGAVTRSYVSNLKNGRIDNPGLAKLGAIAGAMGFLPALWFGDRGGAGGGGRGAALEDGAVRAVVEETLRLGPRDRELLLGIARQISPPTGVGSP